MSRYGTSKVKVGKPIAIALTGSKSHVYLYLSENDFIR